DYADKQILDLFAGTGALGFEAASRGVAHVQMVEVNSSAIAALRALRGRLKAENVRIHAGDALTVLDRLDRASFDLIMLDPPFDQGWLDRVYPRLPDVLRPDGLLYIEAGAPLAPPAGFQLLRQSRAGQVHFHLLRFAATQKTDNNPAI